MRVFIGHEQLRADIVSRNCKKKNSDFPSSQVCIEQ